MKSNNSKLYNKLNMTPGIEVGKKVLIYKNDLIIGYLCYLHCDELLNDILDYTYDDIIRSNYIDYFDKIQNIFKNKNILYLSAFEIFKEYRSFNTLKVVFNMIKKYLVKNTYQILLCHADTKPISRLYQICGFKILDLPYPDDIPVDDGSNILMYLDINQTDYYEVTEKLKNKYKKNLFENMKNTKKLYETIMASVAKQVKKAINEGEYRNDYSSREDYEDEGLDVQGDTEAWINGIKHFLNDNISSEHTLPLLATVVGWNELDDEELRGLAESIMLYVEKYGDEELPAFDEVFIDPVTDELFNNRIIDDWMADVVNENKIDAYDI